ncbi:MAG: transglutaminase-like domain-containing protein [Anaerolineales bacterium]|jgi:hypothetical protein
MTKTQDSIRQAFLSCIKVLLCLGLICLVILGAYFWIPANVHYHITERYIFLNSGKNAHVSLGVIRPKSGPYQWVGNFNTSWEGVQQEDNKKYVDVIKLSGKIGSQETLEAIIEYDVKLVQGSVTWTAPVESFQRLPQPGIESDCAVLKEQTSNLIVDIPGKDVYKIYSFITDYLTYSTVNMDRTSTSALKAYEVGSCVCAGYARLMTALCRASDIPSQMVIGFVYPDPWFASKPSSVSQGDAHAWVEYYSESQWKMADPAHGSGQLKILYFNRNDGRHISYGEFEQTMSVIRELDAWGLNQAGLIVGDDNSLRYFAASTSEDVEFLPEISIHRTWDGRWVNTAIFWVSSIWLLCKFRYKIITIPPPKPNCAHSSTPRKSATVEDNTNY